MRFMGSRPSSARRLPGRAMKLWPPSTWWHNQSLKPLDQHPIAHAMGGAAMFLGFIAAWYLWPHLTLLWRAVLVTSVGQFVWEWIQVEVTPGYSFTESGVWDWLTATLVAAVLALVGSLL